MVKITAIQADILSCFLAELTDQFAEHAEQYLNLEEETDLRDKLDNSQEVSLQDQEARALLTFVEENWTEFLDRGEMSEPEGEEICTALELD